MKKKNNSNYKKLYLMISVVPHNKRSLIMDLIETYEVNYHVSFFGNGSASEDLKSMLGLTENNRDIILSIIREDRIKDCLLAIEDKLGNYKHGGIAFTIPLDSIIGVKNYLFLANGGEKNGI